MTETNTAPPRRPRRTPDQMIADLQAQIAAVKARAAEPKPAPAPKPRRTRAIVATPPANSPVAIPATPASLDAQIEARIHAFTVDLVTLIKRAAIEAVGRAISDLGDTTMPETAREHVSGAPVDGQVANLPPVSFDRYERLALERALDESGGHQLAAARLLGIGKSTMYRKVNRLGVELGAPREFSSAQLDAIGVPLAEPVSLDGYERAAIHRALAESGGSTIGAARLMGAGKSTFYRRMRALGVPRRPQRIRDGIGDVIAPAPRKRGRPRNPDRDGQSQKLLDYVIEHPGQRGRDIYEALRDDPKHLGAAMRQLVVAGKLRTTGARVGMAYFPA